VKSSLAPGSKVVELYLKEAGLLDDLERYASSDTRVAPLPEAEGRVTLFAGVSGGVGATTLAWMESLRSPTALLIEAHVMAPLLGFLCELDADSASLLDALQALTHDPEGRLVTHAAGGRVLTLPLAGAPELGEREAALLIEAASRQFAHTLIDAGPLGNSAFAASLLDRAHRLVLVSTAAPSGVLRLPGALDSARRDGLDITIVVNRFRNSAAGSKHARSAIRGLVERSCGLSPLFVDDNPAFDGAWLDGAWQELLQAVDPLVT
jgi:MinD-like ATPase involved in chromosome partitioning or flagellar assembly